MAMGRKARQRRQEAIWIAQTDLPRTVAHPFYEQLNRLLEERSFDEWVEQQCTRFYAERMGRPSLAPGRYFRLLLIGYFEGIDSERGIAWRAADSLALRSFLGAGLNEMPPDHSTISRTRRLIDVETHQAVFRWVLQLLAEKGLLKGKTVGIRCHDLGGERSLALDCATGDGRGLSGVPQAAGAGIVVVQATSAMCSPAWGRVSRIVAVSPASPVATVTATTAPVSRSTACSAL